MKFENTEVMNFKGAIRGMRNPMNSWDKSDSRECRHDGSFCFDCNHVHRYCIGKDDLKLARKLIKAGSTHRKFLRQIFVSVDITAPMYVYSEFDTYKVGTVANSTSKMHKLATTPITIGCFEIDDYDPLYADGEAVSFIINHMEKLRLKYLKTNDEGYWKELIRWLPESWQQKRTVTMSYENLWSIYNQRKNHKLTEWHTFCRWAESLPYFKEFFLENLENKEIK